MDVEVRNFLSSLGTNPRKADLTEKADFLTAADPEWIVTLQTQLSQDHWVDCSLDAQLSILYVLNAYFKTAFGRADLTNWIGVLEKMVDTLHITSAQHEKETKHVLKLVNIWAIPIKAKEVNGKKASAKYSSIFPKGICDAWIAKLKQRALSCGITISEAPVNAEPGMAPSVSVGAFDKQLSLMNPNSNVQSAEVTGVSRQDTRVATEAPVQSEKNNIDTATQEPVVYSVNFIRATEETMHVVRALTAREKLKNVGSSSQRSGASVGGASSSSSSSNKGSQSNSATQRTSTNTGTGAGTGTVTTTVKPIERPAERSINVIDEMQQGVIRAMCLFQAQIFKHFLDTQPKRLDRWNMHIVMVSSYYLLHMYVAERGTCEADSAALVVACIYLAGKAEYLFVKADRLRSVANRFVRVLNESQMLNNLQIYKYEAELLRMLQYDVGVISNPLRCLKALDIVEARSQGQIVEPAGSASASATTTATTATATATLTAANLSAVTSPAGAAVASAAPQPISQTRRLLDQAAAVFLAEHFLFSADMLHVSSDFYLAAIVLLEKTYLLYSDDEHECRTKYGTFLCDLNQLNTSVRRGCLLNTACSAPGDPQLSFLETMAAMRSKESLDSLREEGEISSGSSEESKTETPIFPVSPRCVELVLECLSKIEKVEADKERARMEQDLARLQAGAARLAAAKAASDAMNSKQSNRTKDRQDRQDDPRERGFDRDPSRGRHEDRYERRADSASRYTSKDARRDDSRSRAKDRDPSRDRGDRSRGRSPADDGRGRRRGRVASRSPSRDRRLADRDQGHRDRTRSPDRRYRERSEDRSYQRGDRRSRDRRSLDRPQERGYGRSSRDRGDQDYRTDRRDRWDGASYGGSRHTSRSPSRDYGALSAPIAPAPSRGRSRDRDRQAERGDSGRRQESWEEYGPQRDEESRERRRKRRGGKKRRRSRSPKAPDSSHPAETESTGDRRRDRGDDPRDGGDLRGISEPIATAPKEAERPEQPARPAKRSRTDRAEDNVLEEGEQAEDAEPRGGAYCQNVSLASQYPSNVAYTFTSQQQSQQQSPQLPQLPVVPPPLARGTEAGEGALAWFSEMSPDQRPTTVEIVGDTSPTALPSQPSAVDLTSLPSSSTHQVVYSLTDTQTSAAPLRSAVAQAKGSRRSPRSSQKAATASSSTHAVPADDAGAAMDVIELASSADSAVECVGETGAPVSADHTGHKSEHVPAITTSMDVQETLQDTQLPAELPQPSEMAMDVSDSVCAPLVVRSVPASLLKRARSASSASAASNSSSAGASNAAAGGGSESASSPRSATSSGNQPEKVGAIAVAASPAPSSAVSTKASPAASAATTAATSTASAAPVAGKVVTIASGGSMEEQMRMRAAKFASPAVPGPSSAPSSQSAAAQAPTSSGTHTNNSSAKGSGNPDGVRDVDRSSSTSGDRHADQHRQTGGGGGRGNHSSQQSRINNNSSNAQMRTERDAHRDTRQGKHAHKQQRRRQ